MWGGILLVMKSAKKNTLQRREKGKENRRTKKKKKKLKIGSREKTESLGFWKRCQMSRQNIEFVVKLFLGFLVIAFIFSLPLSIIFLFPSSRTYNIGLGLGVWMIGDFWKLEKLRQNRSWELETEVLERNGIQISWAKTDFL